MEAVKIVPEIRLSSNFGAVGNSECGNSERITL